MPDEGVRSPIENHSRFHGTDWSPQRVAFHQNLEEFADRVGLIVGLQSNGKVGQEEAIEQIKECGNSSKTVVWTCSISLT